MNKNLDLYEKDPRTHTLLNQGVAKVTSGQSAAELDTLRYEVSNFVCDGQYADGLARILSEYLGHLDKSEQPGVWVSGFYGSGKSHLVKMMQHLWTDFEFPDGAKARGVAKLTSEVKDHLKELTNAAKRAGGLHAAAGDLRDEGKDSIRLSILAIIFKSVGLPGDFNRASFLLWLREEGLDAGVRDFVKRAGCDFDRELANLYVSDPVALAILDARPGFASKPADVKLMLKSQFPPDRKEVSVDDMVARIEQALSRNGKLPLTIVILDEVQQYINEDPDRSKAVQDVKEHLCGKLGSRFLLVGTGQNALSGTSLLKRLQGRFPVTVELQDTDVEQVTREVVLKKKPSAEPALKALLDAHSGEIERQLSATKIAFTSRDRSLLVKDYPILPVRRRFWEKVLRAVDKAGTDAQLRNQLWVVYDAVKQTAEWPVGHVVSGAFIYNSSIKGSTLKSGVLLQEISENIARQSQEEDGELRYQLCALIFLIGQLPHQGPADAGVRADADTLADLLVTDLTVSSSGLRMKVPELLGKLVTGGAVMKVEDEYRMQTREGSEWNQAYLEAKNKLLADAGKLGSERSQRLRTHCTESLKKLKLVQGASKESRKINVYFGDTAPDADGGVIPVWVRDGWDVEVKTVQNDARAAGDTAAIVFAHIPKKQDHELRQEIASFYAAETTLQAKGTPANPEGVEARKAMETRLEQAQRDRDRLVTEILNDVSVYVAGGDEKPGTLLNQKVEDAARACLDRLYPKFDDADSPDWHKVIERSKRGAGDALAVVGHDGSPESHPVCKAVLDYVGVGRKGTDVRKQFGGAKYGWPQDAIDAALIVLFQSGAVTAKTGTELVPKGKLDQKSIAAVEFRVENVKLSKAELIALRGLFQKVGLTTQPDQEAAHAVEFLTRLTKLAEAAGGDAPLPKPPDTAHLVDITNRVGNEQLKMLHKHKDRLGLEIAEWQTRRGLVAQRHPRWRELRSLLDHAADLAVAAEVRPEVAAIEQHRGLLADPNPVPTLTAKVAAALRGALNDAHAACVKGHDAGMASLEASANWQQLEPVQRYELLSKSGARVVPAIAVGTTEEVLTTLGQTKLSELKAVCDALPTRFNIALASAARLLEPKAQSVSLPGGTIKSEADLQVWFEAVKARVLPKLKDGPVIV